MGYYGYRRNDPDLIDIVFALLVFCVTIIILITHWDSFKSISGLFLLFLALFLLYVNAWMILWIVSLFTYLFTELRDKWKLKNILCPHGVKGGKTFSRCEICLKEEQNSLQAIEEQKKLAKLRAEIKSRAETLRDEELERLEKLELRNKDKLLSLSPKEFEDSVVDMYRRLGYSVQQTSYSDDFGIDAAASKNGIRYAIECKRYKNRKIGRPLLQKFYGAMMDENVDKGIYVTTFEYTDSARAYAAERDIELVDLDKLVLLMRRVFPEDRDESFMRVMCLQCEDIVVFRLNLGVTTMKCTNGHTVNLRRDIEHSDSN